MKSGVNDRILANMECCSPSCNINDKNSETLCNKHLRLNNTLTTYQQVKDSGDYNYKAARIPVPSNFHIEAWEKYQDLFTDHRVVDYIKYGFPVDYEGCFIPTLTPNNHSSALAHPKDIQDYIDCELEEGALLRCAQKI